MRRLKKRTASLPEKFVDLGNEIIDDLKSKATEIAHEVDPYDGSPEEISVGVDEAIDMFLRDDERTEQIAEELGVSVDKVVSMIANLPAIYDLAEDIETHVSSSYGDYYEYLMDR